MLFFFRKKIVCGNALRELHGPAIIVSNHPNSMVDAIVIGCLCRQPVHFTIRSDMFKNRLFNLLLKRLNGIPIYRQSEDKERMRDNFTSIEYCTSILQRNGIIIIFAEGVTSHDWKLKPLKSGPSKIVSHALTSDLLKETLQVLPVGLTYSNYSHSSKTIIIQTGNIIFPGRIQSASTGQWKQLFNDILQKGLQPLIPEMTSNSAANIALWESILTQAPGYIDCARNVGILHTIGETISQPGFHFAITSTPTPRFWANSRTSFIIDLVVAAILFIPALPGCILNGAFYFPVQNWSRSKTRGTIFYDSLLFGLLTILYPAYVLLLSLIFFFTMHIPLWLSIVATPLSALCAARWRVLFLKVRGFIILKKEDLNLLQKFFTRSNAKTYSMLKVPHNAEKDVTRQ